MFENFRISDLIISAASVTAMLLSVLPTSAAAGKVDLLAELDCTGQTDKGRDIFFQISGVYKVVRIGGRQLPIEDMNTKDKLVQLSGHSNQGRFTALLSKNLRKVKAQIDDQKITGQCKDTLKGADDSDDDTDQPGGGEFGAGLIGD